MRTARERAAERAGDREQALFHENYIVSSTGCQDKEWSALSLRSTKEPRTTASEATISDAHLRLSPMIISGRILVHDFRFVAVETILPFAVRAHRTEPTAFS